MKKIILTILTLILMSGAGYFIYQNTKTSAQNGYYEKLAQECQQKSSPDCCLSSLEAMKKDNAHKINAGDMCSYGYKKESMLCIDSFSWCRPLSINETSKDAFYQSLRDKCETNNFKECCLDSVKAMEVVGATKLLPKGKDNCRDGLERMTLRCPGSYTWCQTLNNPEGEDFVPVPMTEPKIKPNHPEISGPGFEPKPDFIPTKDNSIHLPDNVMTEKECTEVGGEVWNTLGETTYDGKLIGKIEGLNCPCACLIKNK